MSTFIALATYDARQSMAVAESTSTQSIRVGILKAVADGKQDGADLSALWTPKSGKRTGVPSDGDYIVKQCIMLCEKHGINPDSLTFDVRVTDKQVTIDGKTFAVESCAVFNAAKLTAYVASKTAAAQK